MLLGCYYINYIKKKAARLKDVKPQGVEIKTYFSAVPKLWGSDHGKITKEVRSSTFSRKPPAQ